MRGPQEEREEGSQDLTATIRHTRQDEDQSLSMRRSLQSMEEVDQVHSMVDQGPCEDHHMGQVVMVPPWETLHSMLSTGDQGILLNRVTCPTSLLPHPAMLQEHHMGNRVQYSARRQDYSKSGGKWGLFK